MTSQGPLVDLSNHYVMKKFHDGWLVGPIEGGEPRFVSRAQLIEMGYLNGVESNALEPSPTPTAIVVPTAKSRADLDPDWRKNKK